MHIKYILLQDDVTYETTKSTTTRDTSTKPKSFHETKQCCELEPYDKNIFESCETHLQNECKGFTILEHVTQCKKLDSTLHVNGQNFKGICTPSKYNCISNTDCPILKIKQVFISANCTRENICKYTI